MFINDKTRKKLRKNLTLRWISRIRFLVWAELYSKKKSDLDFVSEMYAKGTGRELNLVNPKRYTEKLQWLKLFYRDPLITRCSDKYEMKNYLKEAGHPELAVETLGIYDNADDIDFESLPHKFILKATHGSGWNLIGDDKSKVDWKGWKRLFKIWSKENPHWLGREWNYKGVKPRIILEKFLEDDSGELRDYKIFCFNGNPTYMQIDENRFSDHKRLYFERNGQPLDMVDSQIQKTELTVKFGEVQERMFQIAEELSKPFPMVRVDFYESNGNLYIGEFTFFDGSGFYNFEPNEWDFVWGEKLQLPEPNHNLELYNKLYNKN